jgi:hypothetical protein
MPGSPQQPMDLGDPAAPTNPTGSTPAVLSSSFQPTDLGDPAPPRTPPKPTGPISTIPSSPHEPMDIEDLAAPMLPSSTLHALHVLQPPMDFQGQTSVRLSHSETPRQMPNLPPRHETGSRYGIRLTDGEGNPRAPAVIGDRSELQAFGFPITGPHPIFENRKGPPQGSYWVRYETILGRGSVDIMARPRALDFSRYNCTHLFVWPNPRGGGFIFLLTDTPISNRPDLGLLDSDEEGEEEEDEPTPPAQAAEPLTPPSTPPRTQDVRMLSPPLEDVHMQPPQFARPGEPGTPPGTPPSRRRETARAGEPGTPPGTPPSRRRHTTSYSPTRRRFGHSSSRGERFGRHRRDRSRSPQPYSLIRRTDRSSSPSYHFVSNERRPRPPSTYHGTASRNQYAQGRGGSNRFNGPHHWEPSVSHVHDCFKHFPN